MPIPFQAPFTLFGHALSSLRPSRSNGIALALPSALLCSYRPPISNTEQQPLDYLATSASIFKHASAFSVAHLRPPHGLRAASHASYHSLCPPLALSRSGAYPTYVGAASWVSSLSDLLASWTFISLLNPSFEGISFLDSTVVFQRIPLAH